MVGCANAESTLAQVFALEDKHVSAAEVGQILGTTTHEEVYALLTAFVQKDLGSAIKRIDAIVEKGYNLETLSVSLIAKARALLFSVVVPDTRDDFAAVTQAEQKTLAELASHVTHDDVLTIIAECQTAKNDISRSSIPQLPLEIAAVHICGHTASENSDAQAVPPQTASKNVTAKKESTKTQEDVRPKKSEHKTPDESTLIDTLKKNWTTCVASIKEEHPTLAMILASSAPYKCVGETLVIGVQFAFHKEKLLENETKKIITDALAVFHATPLDLDAEVIDEKTLYEQSSSPLLSEAARAMGGQMLAS